MSGNPGVNINSGLFVTNNVHKADIKYGPWNDLEEFKAFIDSDYWSEGLTFALRDENQLTEYWFVGGNTESHIEEKFKALSAIVSFWISPPVKEIVETLPTFPEDGDRYLHDNIIKEYDDNISTWIDQYGGSGIELQDGMAVIVLQEGVLLNQTYVYNGELGEWENKTAQVGVDESRYVTAYIDGIRRARDFTGANAPTHLKYITSSGQYLINRNLSGLPISESGTAFLEVLSRTNILSVYKLYDETGIWILKVDGNFENAVWQDLKGDPGEDGDVPEFRVEGDYIQWKLSQEGEGDWKNLIELSQFVGDPGEDGEPVEIRVDESWLQWKYETDSIWTNLFNLNTLVGDTGPPGDTPEFRVTSTHIQWKYVEEAGTEWRNLIALSELEGPPGPAGQNGTDGVDGQDGQDGQDGKNPQLRVSGSWLQWRYEGDTSWNNLFNFDTLQPGGSQTFVSINPPDVQIEGVVWIKEDTLERYYLYDSGGNLTWVQVVIDSPLLNFTDNPIVIDSVNYQNIHIETGEGSITVVASGGIGNLIYTLMPSEISQSDGHFIITEEGTYTVIVSDYAKTTETDNITIQEVEAEPLWYDWFDVLWFEDQGGIEGEHLITTRGDDIPIVGDTHLDIKGTLYSISDLIEIDFYPELPVYYDNEHPYTIRGLGLLKTEIIDILNNPSHEDREDVIDELHQLFDLYMYWSGEWNEYGVMKANRQIGAPEPDPVWATYNFTHLTDEGADDGTITFSNPTGGGGTYEYSIDGGADWQSSPEFTGLEEGEYVLWVRDAEDTDNYADLATVNLIVQTDISVLFDDLILTDGMILID